MREADGVAAMRWLEGRDREIIYHFGLKGNLESLGIENVRGQVGDVATRGLMWHCDKILSLSRAKLPIVADWAEG